MRLIAFHDSNEATVMVTGFRCNQSAKFDSFEKAAAFVYGEGWVEDGQRVFVHWGPQGRQPLLSIRYIAR